MQIMWFLGGFLACAVPGLVAVLRARRIRAAARAADPWLNPPTARAKRLLAVTREQLDVILASEGTAPSLTLPKGAALLPYLTPRNGVVFFHDGVAVLPYGSEARVTSLADATVAALQDAYLALDAASELAGAYVASLDVEQRTSHPNPLVPAIAQHPGGRAFNAELSRLAELLDIDESIPVVDSVITG